jgi:SIR2-like domain
VHALRSATMLIAMPDFRIPDDLARMLSEQRVIPFLGAGFSASQGLPGWEKLLADVANEVQSEADDIPKLSYRQIAEACGNDNLQVAEYLYLRAGNSIGPIRHVMTKSLQGGIDPMDSSAHVELANLGATQVYTTNFDDLIEDTYRALALPVEVIGLPRHLAQSHHGRTQVVKYHGDLRHDPTLVLTESQYYARLDFESPMDLKFRSDLLGRAVLFMGYSFRDINIRVIWFKLMEMMKDVPLKDRPPSYIVRLAPNPVLDALYEAVGLRTIIIDPEEEAKNDAQRVSLLDEFMLALSTRASRSNQIPGSDDKMYMSRILLSQIDDVTTQITRQNRTAFGRAVMRRSGQVVAERVVPSARLMSLLDQLASRRIHPRHREDAEAVLGKIATNVNLGPSVELFLALVRQFVGLGASGGLTFLVADGLMSYPSRIALLQDDLDWDRVWEGHVDDDEARLLLSRIRVEVAGHRSGDYQDEDLAYAVDIAYRIAHGEIVARDAADVMADATALLEEAGEEYPSVADYRPVIGAPSPDDICNEIREREEALEDSDDPPWA